MICSDSLYPALGRYFKNQTELAHAVNKSRTYVWECMVGKRSFTRFDKKAIAAHIFIKEFNKRPLDEVVLNHAICAYKGSFDEIYKRKGIEDHV